MNAIDTIEDLMQILDENPEWLEAMRARLLTRELLELPEKLTQLAARVDSLAAKLERFVETTNQRLAALEAQAEATNQHLAALEAKTDQRFDRLETKVDGLETKVDGLETKVDGLETKVDGLETKVDGLETKVDGLETKVGDLETKVDGLGTKVQSIEDSVGLLKGAHARSAALGEASSIAREMGLLRTKNLSRDDLWELIDRADTAGIRANEMKSFRRADLIMEVTDSDGETCYIAVEISFTANGRDTTRAIRNAEFLTRFTGKQAYAAVAGRYRDDRIQGDIESGKIFWYPLDPEVLDAE